jgi:hypothetical protein
MSASHPLRRRDVKREENPPFFALFDQILFWHKKDLSASRERLKEI